MIKKEFHFQHNEPQKHGVIHKKKRIPSKKRNNQHHHIKGKLTAPILGYERMFVNYVLKRTFVDRQKSVKWSKAAIYRSEITPYKLNKIFSQILL